MGKAAWIFHEWHEKPLEIYYKEIFLYFSSLFYLLWQRKTGHFSGGIYMKYLQRNNKANTTDNFKGKTRWVFLIFQRFSFGLKNFKRYISGAKKQQNTQLICFGDFWGVTTEVVDVFFFLRKLNKYHLWKLLIFVWQKYIPFLYKFEINK